MSETSRWTSRRFSWVALLSSALSLGTVALGDPSQVDSIVCDPIPNNPYCLNQRNARRAQEFLQDLRPVRRRMLLQSIQLMDAMSPGVLPLTRYRPRPGRPELPTVVFIQGLYMNESYEWYRPLQFVMEHGIASYFVRYDSYSSIESIADSVERSLREIRAATPGKELVIFAYSAGGVPTLLAWRNILNSDIPGGAWETRTRLVTVAVPLGGYGAPPLLADLATMAYGRLVSQLGQDQNGRLGAARIPGCVHHITTNCSLDFHACPVGDEGLTHQTIDHMPCSRVIRHPHVDHHLVLLETLENEILGYPIR